MPTRNLDSHALTKRGWQLVIGGRDTRHANSTLNRNEPIMPTSNAISNAPTISLEKRHVSA